MNEQYKCQSYYDDNNVLQDCTCGKCNQFLHDECQRIARWVLDDYVETVVDGVTHNEVIEFIEHEITKLISKYFTPKDQVQAECETYLDAFVKYVFEQPMNQGLWHEYVENFKSSYGKI